jgi:hypothetical protein
MFKFQDIWKLLIGLAVFLIYALILKVRKIEMCKNRDLF